MWRRNFWLIAIACNFLLLMSITGCNLGRKSEGEMALTSVIQTANARLTQAPLPTSPTAANSPAIPTKPGLPTLPPLPPTSPPAPTVVPCNWVGFEGDEDLPDNTAVDAGKPFVKKWRIKNKGTCTWNTGYQLVFERGDRMDSPGSVALTNGVVQPGDSVVVSIPLNAPVTPGSYQGFFIFRAPDGVSFGTGEQARNNIWVKIVSVSPATTGTVTPSVTPTVTAAIATATPQPTVAPLAADLAITDFTISPVSPVVGQPVTVSITVFNYGDKNASLFTVKWLPGDNFPENQTCSWLINGLNAKAGAVLTLQGPNNPSNDCTTYIYTSAHTNLTTRTIVDLYNTVAENNETNNQTSKVINVIP